MGRLGVETHIVTARRTLGTGGPFHIGLNYRYLARKVNYTALPGAAPPVAIAEDLPRSEIG